ncbi:hypothetical protein [Lentzea flaviverrucosa]|uniref:Uncharacterized protein n=1 Tax=Lentzea flaviverrucosa TaxID=200379 RepID=A0A1H9XVH4_9PSEU|nr:hypothetical protein [Lentzea flaviverrucosa]RDI18248.1 hypothetical protein DFR72_11942 [Lentzea flaviverrucosa]SES50185.1 hypothetical protein SAMN05216195_11942 [Lentzea flaviverrucosa]
MARTGLTYSEALAAEIECPQASPGQAAFEAQLLRKIGNGLRPYESGSAAQIAFGVRDVVVGRNKLVIVLASRRALVAFASAVVPVLNPDRTDLEGIPGLRVEYSDVGVELRLRLRHRPGRIVLDGVGAAQWIDALEHTYDRSLLASSAHLGDERSLHPIEDRVLRSSLFVKPPRHVARRFSLLSAILRRPNVFRFGSWMRFTDLWFDLSSTSDITVEWSGDLSSFDVASRLVDPRNGLPLRWHPEMPCLCEPCIDRRYAVALLHVDDPRARIWLTRSDLYDDEFPRGKPRRCMHLS